jgi:hypothetical protein
LKNFRGPDAGRDAAGGRAFPRACSANRGDLADADWPALARKVAQDIEGVVRELFIQFLLALAHGRTVPQTLCAHADEVIE